MRLRPKDIKQAESTKYLGLIAPSGDPERDLQMYTDVILRKGWHLTERTESNPFSDWTTTFHRRIALKHGFWNQPVWAQQATLGHELVHIEQRIDIGRHRFNVRYMARPRWRWILETQAYRESVRNLKARGATSSQIDAYIDYVIKTLRKRYVLGILGDKQMKRETRRILLLGAA